MDQLKGHIVIISGSPGSGKTTTAQAIAHHPGIAKVHVHSDDFWGNIKTGHIPPWLPEADAQNHMVNQIAADVCARYAENGYLVLLDGVVRPSWLPAFEALGLPVHYLVLRTSVEDVVTRCLARGGDSLTDPAVVTDLHGQFAALGAYENHVLPTTGLDRKATINAVIAALESGAYRLS
ncbi:shikimate kinase [Devosia soli]|uniref:Shikimate kinase n=1 Tax=Devosia soli TaxID=361041 RepID=A0A0F5L836_9HYPH|nr:AAA family ATPase [Devosia soli]KKB78374.1 shikimate kinase [Devosia soli]